jgi:glycine cleavage system H protein
MSTTRYSKDHEWVRLDGDQATCGITNYAQEQLGDVVFVELPEVGATLASGDEAAVVESVKAAAEVYAPVIGEVVAVNDAIVNDPSLVNADPEGEGWFFRLSTVDTAGFEALMDEEAYEALLEELG